MIDDAHHDQRISELIRSVHAEVPDALDRRIRAAAREEERKTRARGRILRWALVPTAATALLLAAALVWPVFFKPAPTAIAEIRTEFEIPGKDIKIVFFQKPDFKLFQED
jgi:hypothetical protein